MGALEAAPAGVLMPRGCDDMSGPPPGASPARQPEWLRRHAPADYAPPPLLASLALEAERWGGQSPAACITGARVGNDYVIISAAGPARDLVSVSTLPAAPGAASPTSLNLEGLKGVGHRPWYARASAPLLQLSLSGAAPGGWADQGQVPVTPLLAARSASAVEIWQLERQERRWRLGPQLGAARSGGSGGSGGLAGELVDVAWGRHLAQRCAVLRRDGSILEVTLSPAGAATTLAWTPGPALTAALPFLDPSAAGGGSTSPPAAVLRCAFPSCHPRQLLVSLHTTLGVVDLRGGSGGGGGGGRMLPVFNCVQGEWISALAAAPDPEAAPPAPFLAAAATPTRVLVFDLRRPQVPLVEWEHGMEAEGKAKSARALRFAAPDTLQWLPIAAAAGGGGGGGTERRVLASCSWSGRGVVCEWEERRTRGGVAVGAGGQLRETALEEVQKEKESDGTFFFEPAWWTEAKARRPPQLLFDLQIGYPRALGEAAGGAAAAQRRRAVARALRAGEEQQAPHVMLLPAPRHGPALLGVAALSHSQWAGNDSATAGGTSGGATTIDRDFVLVMLSSTQEILLSTVRPRQPAAPAASQPPPPLPPPPTLYPSPMSPNSGEESGEGEVVFMRGRAQARRDPQVELAAAAAAGAAPTDACDGEAGGLELPPDGPQQSRIRIKKVPFVDLPLHRWLLEEAIRQHGMPPEQHTAAFGTPEGGEMAAGALGDVTEAAQVAFTAQEAWQALVAPSPHAHSALEGHVPSTTGPGRRRKGTRRGATVPAQALTAALTRGGLLPLAPGQRAVPIDGSEPLAPQNPALPFFPGLFFAQEAASLVAAAAVDPGQPSSSAAPRARVPSPLQLLRAAAPPPQAAARSGAPTLWGVAPAVPAPAAAAAGSELVYAPPIGGVSARSSGLGRGTKPPSTEAQAALEQLRNAWGGVE